MKNFINYFGLFVIVCIGIFISYELNRVVNNRFIENNSIISSINEKIQNIQYNLEAIDKDILIINQRLKKIEEKNIGKPIGSNLSSSEIIKIYGENESEIVEFFNNPDNLDNLTDKESLTIGDMVEIWLSTKNKL